MGYEPGNVGSSVGSDATASRGDDAEVAGSTSSDLGADAGAGRGHDTEDAGGTIDERAGSREGVLSRDNGREAGNEEDGGTHID